LVSSLLWASNAFAHHSDSSSEFEVFVGAEAFHGGRRRCHPERSVAYRELGDDLLSVADTVEHRRTVGKQFPPYDADCPDSWGVEHLMHPELNEHVFVRWYTSDGLMNVAKHLLGCEERDLQGM